MVRECFITQEFDRVINKTFITLIPKMKGATNFNQFRPINLCNFIYKIVYKLIAMRLRKNLANIISPNQGVFVEGKWIVENTVAAYELVHKIKSAKENMASCL